MEKLRSEYHETLKQQLIARGMSTADVSECEKQVDAGDFENLIDAVRQNDFLDESDLSVLVTGLKAKFTDDELNNQETDEDDELASAEIAFSMPALDDDSGLFMPNVNPFGWQQGDSEYSVEADSQNSEAVDEVSEEENTPKYTAELLVDQIDEPSEAIIEDIASPDDLVEDSLKAKREVDLNTGKIKPAVTITNTKNPDLDIKNLAGQILAERYELIELLGFDGISAIYKSRKLKSNKKKFYAIRIIRPETDDPAKFLNQFKQDAEKLQKLSHGPNIIRIKAFGKDKDLYYLAMNFVDGESLANLIARKAPLSEELTFQIASEVLKALYHTHSNGIVHRNIKLGNILIGKDGAVQLTDFNFSYNASIQNQVQPGQDWGVLNYLAPEQINKKKIDVRTDLYSLGVVLFECLTGQHPFMESTPQQLISSISTKNPEKPSKINPKISSFTDKIILQLLKKEPRARIQSVKELNDVLAKAKLTNSRQNIGIEEKIDQPAMPAKPYSGSLQKGITGKVPRAISSKISSLFRKSKRFSSQHVTGVNESQNAIPYPGLKPSASRRQEARSARMKNGVNNKTQKLKPSMRYSQKLKPAVKGRSSKGLWILAGVIVIIGILIAASIYIQN